jgi:hypothetical protein
MRFMLLIIPRGYEKTAPGAMPDAAAVDWASRCPASDNEIIEVRQVQELSDFPADVQKAAAGFSEMQPQPKERRKA